MNAPLGPMPIEGLAFHHIGVACRNLDAEERVFGAIGYSRTVARSE